MTSAGCASSTRDWRRMSRATVVRPIPAAMVPTAATPAPTLSKTRFMRYASELIVGLLLKVYVVETLISDKNPLLKEVRRLAAGGAPGEERLVLAEGPHLLDEALRSGIEIHAVILAESASREIRFRGATRVVRVLDGLFNKLASTESPQGVLALVRLPGVDPARPNPGNASGGGPRWRAGSRKCRSHPADGGGLWSHGRGVPQGHGQSVQSQMPASFGGLGVSSARWFPWNYSKAGLALYAADPRAKLFVADARLWPCLAPSSSEARETACGPSLRRAQRREDPDHAVESLNAAVAAGILLYEARRQRGT